MGNVPISCCRSKTPRQGTDGRYSEGNSNASTEGLRSSIMQQASQNTLQHISEREPDDTDTDPSSNALNRPIFAQRSSSSKNQQCRLSSANESYSSNHSSSITRKSTLNPLSSSQDQGYNSSASTNLTHFDGKEVQVVSGSLSSCNNHDTQVTDPREKLDIPDTRVQIDKLKISDRTSRDVNDDTNAHNDVPTILAHSRRYFSLNRRDDSQFPINCEDRLKASSCSTIYIDNSTISQPDLDQTIKCVSLAIYYHIRNRSSETVSDIFDESKHPLRMPSSPSELTLSNQPIQAKNNPDHASQPQPKTEELITLDNDGETISNSQKQIEEPDQETIYNFVRSMFKAAQLKSEYAITTLVYLERLMTYAEMDLTPRSWRRMFLGANLLSSKVWEDQAIWNVDYAQILEEISVEDINELERQFLELIEFNMNVPSSVYAKYYFHLRTLALKNSLTEKQTLMTTGRARDLEAMSNVYATDDLYPAQIHRKSRLSMKKHTSLERLRLTGSARAVLM